MELFFSFEKCILCKACHLYSFVVSKDLYSSPTHIDLTFFKAHLSAKRCWRWVSSVSSINRNMLNCLISSGQHTSVMQVYRHCGVRRLSNTVTGTPTAPSTVPTKPRHSRRQHEMLLELVLPSRDPSWTLPTVLLPVTTMHNLTLTAIKDAHTVHWHREYSHMNSISEKNKEIRRD